METSRNEGLNPPPHDVEVDRDEELLRKVADKAVRMGLAVPAVFFLESSKPLSFIGSQALVFFEPFVKAFLNLSSYDRFSALMEDRKNVERLIRLIEEIEDERATKERDTKRAARDAKAAERAARGEMTSSVSYWCNTAHCGSAAWVFVKRC